MAVWLLLAVGVVGDADLVLETTSARFVAEDSFGTVSLLIRNDGGDAFEGPITLEPSGAGRIGSPEATLSREVYLSPGESRWVVFHPYITDSLTEFDVVWGDARTPLPQVQTNRAGVVLVTSEERVTSLPSAAARLFPTAAHSLEGLRVILLERDVRLQRNQEAALRDWLSLGGTLVIPAGTADFADGLALFNRPGSEWAFGSGRVVRLSFDAKTTTAEDLFAEIDMRPPGLDLTQRRTPERTQNLTHNEARQAIYLDVDPHVTDLLIEKTTPQGLRLLFGLLCVLYAGLVCTVGFYARRHRLPAARTVGLLAAVAGVGCVAMACSSPLVLSGSAGATIAFARELSDSTAGSAGSPLPQDGRDEVRMSVAQWGVYRDPLSSGVELRGAGEHTRLTAAGVLREPNVTDGASQALNFRNVVLNNTTLRGRSIMTVARPRLRTNGRDSLQTLELVDATAGPDEYLGGLVIRGTAAIELDRDLNSTGTSLSLGTLLNQIDYFVMQGGRRRRGEADWLVTYEERVLRVAVRHALSPPTGQLLMTDLAPPPGKLRVFLLKTLPEGLDLFAPMSADTRFLVLQFDIDDRRE